MPKTIKLESHLSSEELEYRYRKAHDPVLRSHYQIIWLISEGKTTRQVMEHTGYSRGCYELWLRSDSMRACRTESLTQVTFPTKNGRLSPLTWRSLEKTLPSAPTICERFSTA